MNVWKCDFLQLHGGLIWGRNVEIVEQVVYVIPHEGVGESCDASCGEREKQGLILRTPFRHP